MSQPRGCRLRAPIEFPAADHLLGNSVGAIGWAPWTGHLLTEVAPVPARACSSPRGDSSLPGYN